ncbi:hypothetical protein SAMN00777080_2295 [Aquiflexum balticum DSM 16537]|uniref:Uncharacterized protein n=1 Tax=Aquiflexum balticum DSM 16537 TaxID=758820 RepID=A0A1W2H4Z0_9BACT|nr:hypothetical protein SAMN00777080_2295 [Aquiflexum balticum DSM 16537]
MESSCHVGGFDTIPGQGRVIDQPVVVFANAIQNSMGKCILKCKTQLPPY